MEYFIKDFADWRNKARALLWANIKPSEVMLSDQFSTANLFSSDIASLLDLPLFKSSGENTLSISRDFIQRAHWVAHHSDCQRWQLLYSLAWRLINEDKNLLANSIDDQVVRFNQCFKAVTRDYHKMKAFVRFQDIGSFTGLEKVFKANTFIEPEYLHRQKQKHEKVKRSTLGSNLTVSADEHYIAWFEPSHYVLPLAARFFVKRFSSISWSILTPNECAHWHKQKLIFTPGVVKPPMPEDQTEQLWLQYYASIFNPARVKVNAMQSEMPKKYWKNLPEAQLIQSLLQRATTRVNSMYEVVK